MTVLTVRLFGPFQVYLGEEPVKGFRSDKSRALLAYLCTEEMRPHRREKLAGLLWPEINEQSARANLRYALANLRQVLGDQIGSLGKSDGFLITTPQTIQLNPASDLRIDVAKFSELTRQLKPSSQAKPNPLLLEQAVDLFRGEFLEGFSLPDSPAFDEWVLLSQERFHRTVMVSLYQLGEYYQESRQYERALPYAWHQLELDPWQETAHRQVMKLLALSGQRAKALIQYESCRRILREALEIEPDEVTRGLYKQILLGDLIIHEPPPAQPQIAAAKVPSFLLAGSTARFERQPFFARERELAQLSMFLESALSGAGQVVFVSGEAGSGKTSLISEFANRASQIHGNLIAVRGTCNALTGIGDPYLPIREILGLLTGDVEARWNARTIPREYALRLWNNLALIVPVLLEHGRDLIETLLPGEALIQRVKACLAEQAAWLSDLTELVKHKAAFPGGHALTQDVLIEQFSATVRALAGHKPLLIILDDLQWADQGSINLLSHFGSHITDTPILVIGAYRSEELTLGRNSEQHPLLPVIHKFRRAMGEITIDLEQAEGFPFIEALIESNPNQLGADFRRTLYELTKGHPLFTIELLRGMQERGDLIKDSQGRWIEGPVLNWDELPGRLEAVIADRIERLSSLEQMILRIASVEGELFTAEVAGRVGKLTDGEMVTLLSSELDRKHQLIRAQGTRHINNQRLSRYHFRHILFQKYLYASLDRIEKEHLHEAVGTAIETLFQNQSLQITQLAPQLARHFQEAGMSVKAIGYHYQAGESAVRLSANEEGMFHYYQSLKLLATLPDLPEYNQQELKILVALTVPLLAIKGYISPELDAVVNRAGVLVRKVGGARELMGTLLRLFLLNSTRGEHHLALEFAQRLTSVAQENQDGMMEAIGFHAQGIVMFCLGEFKQALSHFEKAVDFYDPTQHSASAFIMGQDLGVAGLCWATQNLWMLGYPDQAMQRSQQALALARALDHTFSLGYTQSLAGSMINQLRNDVGAAYEATANSLAFVNKHGFAFLQTYNLVVMGWAQAETGCVEEGIAQILTGIAKHKEMNARIHLPHYQALLARSYTLAGDVEAGLEVANTALSLVEETGERYYEAELQRLKGELLATQGNDVEAEACFLEAVQIARQQHAKSWELRSTTSLARLWQKQGKGKDAKQRLSEIYGWFTEGFGSPDLKEAQSLLSELS